jgi:hypothetical protein
MMFSAVAAMVRRLTWDFPRGGDAHAVVSAAEPFLSDSSTMSPGRFAERHS